MGSNLYARLLSRLIAVYRDSSISVISLFSLYSWEFSRKSLTKDFNLLLTKFNMSLLYEIERS